LVFKSVSSLFISVDGLSQQGDNHMFIENLAKRCSKIFDFWHARNETFLSVCAGFNTRVFEEDKVKIKQRYPFSNQTYLNQFSFLSLGDTNEGQVTTNQ